ncbi:MAG: hypothetical protein WBQ69_03115 [Gallionella sp.]
MKSNQLMMERNQTVLESKQTVVENNQQGLSLFDRVTMVAFFGLIVVGWMLFRTSNILY